MKRYGLSYSDNSEVTSMNLLEQFRIKTDLVTAIDRACGVYVERGGDKKDIVPLLKQLTKEYKNNLCKK